jgi:signal transduction histidine kinase
VRTGALPLVRVDARQLRQLVRNLLENGIKFRRAGIPPEIEVSFRNGSPRRTDAVEVCFHDNGRGFSADEAGRVFHFSERLAPEAEPGNGLGLALCAQIASRIGGEIYANGEPGMGATFHVVLPRGLVVESGAGPQ